MAFDATFRVSFAPRNDKTDGTSFSSSFSRGAEPVARQVPARGVDTRHPRKRRRGVGAGAARQASAPLSREARLSESRDRSRWAERGPMR